MKKLTSPKKVIILKENSPFYNRLGILQGFKNDIAIVQIIGENNYTIVRIKRHNICPVYINNTELNKAVNRIYLKGLSFFARLSQESFVKVSSKSILKRNLRDFAHENDILDAKNLIDSFDKSII